MLVVSTAHLYGDSLKRLFCESYKIIPNDKYNPSMLKPTQYAIAAGSVPSDFWTKYTIYYVDTNNKNKLTCAYEYEELIDQMKFIESETFAVTNHLSDNVIIQAIQVAVRELSNKIADYEELKTSIAEQIVEIQSLKSRITEIENELKPINN